MGKAWEKKGDWNHPVAGTDEYIESSLGEHDDIPKGFAVCSHLMHHHSYQAETVAALIVQM